MFRERVRIQAIVSDLHLAQGGEGDAFENDEEFSSFLAYLREEARALGGRAELIINGDFLDLLWVEPFGADSWRESRAKVKRVRRAHPVVFEALAEFTLNRGGYLTILAGNHDLELAFEDVQAHVAAAIDERLDPRQVFPDEATGPHFQGMARGAFSYRSGGLYIEHGNQFDPFNNLRRGSVQSGRAGDDFRLPWGSHLVYDVVQPLFRDHRFVARVAPHWLAVPLLFLLDPARAMKKVPAMKRLGRAKAFDWIARHASNWAEAAYAGSRGAAAAGDGDEVLGILAEIGPELEQLVAASSWDRRSSEAVARGPALQWARSKVAKFVLRHLTQVTGRTSESDGIWEAACRRARAEGSGTVVCGHTHGARDLSADGVRYLNTGTWIPLYEASVDAEEVLSSEGTLLDEAFEAVDLPTFALVEVDAGEEGVALMAWRGNRPEKMS